MKSLIRMFLDGLLAVSVLCGPPIWLLVIGTAYAAWRPVLGEAQPNVWVLGAAFVLMSWGLWGIFAGPVRLRRWWFLISSLLNMLIGIFEVMSDLPEHLFVAAVFLAYSLWQMIMFRRPAQRLAK